ncbi:hypothetical protein [Actinoplanes sp. CA-252034]|uniref:hypothetical protein n=1 Tax=Actinoplanes sp. CA-252034 TaxID=3239906 RepID=UPI003D97E844
MTHLRRPAQLRASAALHTLEAALDALADRVVDEDRAIRAEQAARAEPLKSPTFGRRHALGGHGDPTGDAVGTLGTPRPNRYEKLEREVHRQLRDVAEYLPGLDSPFVRIQNAVPHMSDRMADATRLLADRVDGRIRRQLQIGHDHQFVPRVPCPACDVVALAIRTAPPLADRIVECVTCGMAWPRAAVLRGAPS